MQTVSKGTQDFPELCQYRIPETFRCYYYGAFTSQQERGAADLTDLQNLKIPQGAAVLTTAATRGAGDSIAALLFHY